MKTLLLLLMPVFAVSQCKTVNPVFSLSTGYQNGFTMSIEGGFWQVKKPFQATIGVMAYNIEKAHIINGKTEIYKEPVADPFVRVGVKLANKGPMIIVISGFASWRNVVGLTSRLLYQIGPVTLAGIEIGATNRGFLAKTGIIFTF